VQELAPGFEQVVPLSKAAGLHGWAHTLCIFYSFSFGLIFHWK